MRSPHANSDLLGLGDRIASSFGECEFKESMQDVVEYLYALDHRKIVFISHAHPTKGSDPRFQGFKEVMVAKGLVVRGHQIQHTY